MATTTDVERDVTAGVSSGRGMVPDDVYELTGVGDPRLHPDGTVVAYVVGSVDREKNEYRSAIWIADVSGETPPRKFTAGTKRDGMPRWSPDGTRLSFVSGREGDEPAQLHVIPFQGGEPMRLTKLKEDIRDVAWSPDGETIAFASRVRDEAYEEEDDKKRKPRRITKLLYKLDNEGWIVDRRMQVFTVPTDGSSEPKQLTDADSDSAEPAWAPDGKRLAFVSARGDDWDLDLVNDIFLVDADGGEPKRLTGADGWVARPVWSPDGTRIAYLSGDDPLNQPRHGQLAVIDVESGERRLLTESLDRQCAPYPEIGEPRWDGDSILFALEDRGNVHVYRVPADGSAEPELVVGGEQQVRGYDVREGKVVHAATSTTTMSELFAGDHRLTDVGRAFVDGRELVEPERFTAVSEDGSEVEAWIVRPAGFEEGRQYPALLVIHGGPFTQYGNGFFDEVQVYAGAGYAVIYSNPRGSSGYSEEWGRAIRGPNNEGPGWGTRDYEDVIAVTDAALEQFGFIDGERLGVMGGSYGGYMTSWIVSHTNRFKAACSERACNNLLSEDWSSDFGGFFRTTFGSFTFEDPEAYLRHSPWSYAKEITTPLLILHSEEDLRCSVEQAESLFVILRALKREVEFVRFPKESHELSRSGSPVHRVMRFETILEWFDRQLKDN
jgi:dipeptidyl aminopeptidase/acylaminoacyl peptidase